MIASASSHKGTSADVRHRTPQALRNAALVLLCSAYLQGGVAKLLDFAGARAEMDLFGMRPATMFAIATIVTELVGSALIISGRLRWLGALWLAGFTAAATFAANRFWELPEGQRMMAANGFFEHLGLIGGFLLVVWNDLKGREK